MRMFCLRMLLSSGIHTLIEAFHAYVRTGWISLANEEKPFPREAIEPDSCVLRNACSSRDPCQGDT